VLLLPSPHLLLQVLLRCCPNRLPPVLLLQPLNQTHLPWRGGLLPQEHPIPHLLC
jgi:hypothetical protein